jgi:hypothetical protein
VCSPLARVIWWSLKLPNSSICSLPRQGFTHSPVFSLLSKGLLCKGLGNYLPWLGLCFYPCGLEYGGKKVPSVFGIEIHT